MINLAVLCVWNFFTYAEACDEKCIFLGTIFWLKIWVELRVTLASSSTRKKPTLLNQNQCDQIGRIWKVLGNKCSPNIWCLLKNISFCKIVGATFWNFWAVFHFKFWSHWSNFTLEAMLYWKKLRVATLCWNIALWLAVPYPMTFFSPIRVLYFSVA